jgi:Calcium binding
VVSHYWIIGDSVMVKPGITERATDCLLNGWQGRLIALSKNEETLTIQWDSRTLKNIPLEYITRCEERGVSWSTMRLAAQDVLLAEAHDREEDVHATIAELETQYSWVSLGEQGRRIRQIVNRAQAHDLITVSETWHAYLQEHLTFPFVATVSESQHGPVPQGAQVNVTGISLLDDSAGTIARARLGRRVYHFPLWELRATNAPAELQQLIYDYAIWFIHHSYVYARSPL